jgi:mono/diheme cytochrome c family protein
MRRLFVIALLCLAAGSAAAEPTFSVAVAGRTQTYSAEDLLRRPETTEITVASDASYRRPMTYRAVPLAVLLSEPGLAADAYLEVTALDGFVSQLPDALVLNRDPAKAVAMLAIEDPAQPWPALPGKQQSAGPFYIVWVGRGAAAMRSEQWPYQVASLSEEVSPLTRWPQLAVAASLPEDDPRRQGQQLFIVECLVCHKLAGGGNAEVGPDLNLPMSPTEYFTLPALQRFLRDPASVRNWPDRRMPAFEPDLLSDADIDRIIMYLQYKAATRK